MQQDTLVDNLHQFSDPPLSELKFNLHNFPRIILLLIIISYQKIVSPSLPPNTCCFYPTCSHYGYQAIYKYGLVKGGWLTFKRICRCNPFNTGGIDPVP